MIQIIKYLKSSERAPGILLVLSAIAAIILANSSYSNWYYDILNTHMHFKFGDYGLFKPLYLWINDGLMAVFFFSVGLEIKREFMEGHLSSPSQVILPVIGAIFGIIVPALIFVFFNHNDSIAVRGWAIPSATDIAFALGALSFFGKRIPVGLKLYLLSVAIFDDIGAIAIIGIFYSSDLSLISFIIAVTGMAILFVLNKFAVKRLDPYIIISFIIWFAVLKSGVHATIAGFIAALFIPLRIENDRRSMLRSLEVSILPWISFFILPAFAFANAGVSLDGVQIDSLLNPVTLGIILGLFIGKQLGIFSVCFIVIKTGFAKLPLDTSWLQFYAVTVLCGIGFTMSLFIGTLAYESQNIYYLNNVKLGVIIGSIISAILGIIIIWISIKIKERRSSI